MGRLQKKRRKLNNRGFSLVELLAAMALLGVVSLAIYTFMNSGARLYQKTSSDADIQTDAQLVANALSDLIVDCEVNVSYGPTVSDRIGGSVSENATPPLEGGGEPVVDNILEIDNNNYQFLLIPDGQNIFYLERRAKTNSDEYEDYDLQNAQLLAQNVTAFSVDLSRLGKNDKNILTFSMTYEKGTRKYSGNYQVNLRNAVTVNEVVNKTVDKTADISKVIVSPDELYVDVKGKIHPQTVPYPLTQIFIASSNATNVTTQKLYTWAIENADTSGASIDGAVDQKECKIKFNNYLFTDPNGTDPSGTKTTFTIPSSFNVVATSTIQNRQGEYPCGVATVYYRKILDMSITPTRGIVQDKMEPKSNAVFTANISDYNLKSSDKLCDWKLYYKTTGEYKECTDKTIATLGTAGSSAYVTLGESANKSYSFKITATSKWDTSWNAEYEFGVSETVDVQGCDSASRGVEIDLTALLKAGKVDWKSDIKEDNIQIDIDKIISVKLVNFSNDDTLKNLLTVTRDGKAYLYLDYNSMRYTEGANQLAYYGGDANIQLDITFMGTNGKIYTKTGVNMKLDPVKLSAGNPDDGTFVLLNKGSYYDCSFVTQGYNISDKSHIGILFYDEGSRSYVNANANQYGMIDCNNYLSASYISSLGNRYTYVNTGVFRLTAKSDNVYYPTDCIHMKVTIDDFYKLCMAYAPTNEDYLERSKYQFDVYVSNVEGQNIFVKEPKVISEEADNDGNTIVKAVSSDVVWNAPNAKKESVSCNIDSAVSVGDGNSNSFLLEFGAKYNENGTKKVLSYYTMKYNNKTYYYNSTYKCWKPVS